MLLRIDLTVIGFMDTSSNCVMITNFVFDSQSETLP